MGPSSPEKKISTSGQRGYTIRNMKSWHSEQEILRGAKFSHSSCKHVGKYKTKLQNLNE